MDVGLLDTFKSAPVKRPVLLIDGLNLFTRHYIKNPLMNSHGEPMGGASGFLYSLATLVDELHPSATIVAWEGGGSTRRRSIFKEYKSQRRPLKLNRYYDGEEMPNTVQNRNDQLKAIIDCLKHVPVNQVYVTECEADDVIAYLWRTHYKDENKVIVSSDHDYYQLLDDQTKIFRPGKQTFVTTADMFAVHGITPANFALAKAIHGDPSDNIPGIKGVGFKTLAKRFPQLGTADVYDIDRLIEEATLAVAGGSKLGVYKEISTSRDLITRNLKLIDLDMGLLTAEQVSKIDYTIENYTYHRDKIGLVRALIGFGLNEFNVESFFYRMVSS